MKFSKIKMLGIQHNRPLLIGMIMCEIGYPGPKLVISIVCWLRRISILYNEDCKINLPFNADIQFTIE